MMRRPGVLRCLAAAVLFGASAPAASLLAGEIPTLVLAGLLYLGTALAVAPVAMRLPAPVRGLRSGGGRLALAIVFGGALGPALLVAGLASVPAATASLLLNFELVATIVIAALVFHEYLGRRLVASVSLVLAAGVLLVWHPGATFDVAGALIVGACVCWGVDNSATARIDQLIPEQITFAKGAIAGTTNLVLGLAVSGATGISIEQVLAALAIGALGYGLSITLWVKGARDLGAARGQVLFATAPFVGAVISWVVLSETVFPYQLVSLVVAAVGVGFSLETAHTHHHRHAAREHDHEHTHDDGHHFHDHGEPVPGRHTHRHRHEPTEHSHPHLPDLHHDHTH